MITLTEHEMRKPTRAGLLSTAVIGWGVLRDWWWVGVLLAIAIEAPRFLTGRKDFHASDYLRAFNLSFLLMGVVAIILWVQDVEREQYEVIVEALPLFFLPVLLCQRFATRSHYPLQASTIMTYWRFQKDGDKRKEWRMDFGYLYLVLTMISASWNLESLILKGGFALLVALLLWRLIFAGRKVSVQSNLCYLAVILISVSSMYGLIRLYTYFESGRWYGLLNNSFDTPAQTSTKLGKLGEIMQDPKIHWRIISPETAPPVLLRDRVFNRYANRSWFHDPVSGQIDKDQDYEDLATNMFQGNPAFYVDDSMTQQDVLDFLNSYQPAVVSADKEMDLQLLGEELANQQLVFVAEQHDRYDHHLNQLALLRLMHEQNPMLSIGVEWFQQPFQSVLDDYLAGKLTETEMLQQSGYYERWRYDFRLLRPILEYAKQHGLPVLALNAPTEITRKVSMEGLEALSIEERAQIPETIHPPQANYRQYLKDIFDEHMTGQGDFERFALIQRIWDETMAANIVKQLQSAPAQRMIVFAGSGHLRSGAIPNDIIRTRPATKLATLHSVERDEITPCTFDYFILSEALSLPPTGKLGVWLQDHPADQEKDEPKPYVTIRQLAEESAAGEAGMLADDRFISLNEQFVQSTADLLFVLAATRRDQEVTVKFSRLVQNEAVTMEKRIKLK